MAYDLDALLALTDAIEAGDVEALARNEAARQFRELIEDYRNLEGWNDPNLIGRIVDFAGRRLLIEQASFDPGEGRVEARIRGVMLPDG